MAKSSVQAEYSIAAVSKLTGVSCHALRVWERRYGFPVPHRSPSGHRRYGAEQVQILRRVSELARGGQSIAELIDGVRTGRIPVEREPSPGLVAEPGTPSAELVSRLVAGRLAEADSLYERLTASMAPVDRIGRLVEPALIDVGERWFRRECDILHERVVTGFFRRKVDAMLDEACRANARPVRTAIIGTIQGDRHAGGILLLGLMLELNGWRAIDLGVDLPAREFQRAVEALRPDAVGLSFILSRNINKRFQELSQIRGIPVFVGGRSILNYQGLARRHGLIPISGSITGAFQQFLAEFDHWTLRNGATTREAGA